LKPIGALLYSFRIKANLAFKLLILFIQTNSQNVLFKTVTLAGVADGQRLAKKLYHFCLSNRKPLAMQANATRVARKAILCNRPLSDFQQNVKQHKTQA